MVLEVQNHKQNFCLGEMRWATVRHCSGPVKTVLNLQRRQPRLRSHITGAKQTVRDRSSHLTEDCCSTTAATHTLPPQVWQPHTPQRRVNTCLQPDSSVPPQTMLELHTEVDAAQVPTQASLTSKRKVRGSHLYLSPRSEPRGGVHCWQTPGSHTEQQSASPPDGWAEKPTPQLS